MKLVPPVRVVLAYLVMFTCNASQARFSRWVNFQARHAGNYAQNPSDYGNQLKAFISLITAQSDTETSEETVSSTTMGPSTLDSQRQVLLPHIDTTAPPLPIPLPLKSAPRGSSPKTDVKISKPSASNSNTRSTKPDPEKVPTHPDKSQLPSSGKPGHPSSNDPSLTRKEIQASKRMELKQRKVAIQEENLKIKKRKQESLESKRMQDKQARETRVKEQQVRQDKKRQERQDNKNRRDLERKEGKLKQVKMFETIVSTTIARELAELGKEFKETVENEISLAVNTTQEIIQQTIQNVFNDFWYVFAATQICCTILLECLKILVIAIFRKIIQ